MTQHSEFIALIVSMGGWLATMIFGVITLTAATLDYFVTERHRYKYAAALRRISWLFALALVCGLLVFWFEGKYSRLAGGEDFSGAPYVYIPFGVAVLLLVVCRWVGRRMSVTVE